jgi:hypothetical protein
MEDAIEIIEKDGDFWIVIENHPYFLMSVAVMMVTVLRSLLHNLPNHRSSFFIF